MKYLIFTIVFMISFAANAGNVKYEIKIKKTEDLNYKAKVIGMLKAIEGVKTADYRRSSDIRRNGFVVCADDQAKINQEMMEEMIEDLGFKLKKFKKKQRC